MTTSLHLISTTVFNQALGALSAILAKADAHATERKIDPNALLHARLYPDMFPLLRQVLVASDFAKGVSARLAGVEVPAYEDSETTFAQLQARIAKTLAFIATLTPQQFEGSESREIVTQPGTPREKRFSGQSYLLNYALPHFYFHVTTAYALLRHNGVELGKKDFIGSY